MAVEPNTCWGPECGALVAARRPSTTGTHWCQRPSCQSAKQRYFRAAKRRAADPGKADERDQFIYDLAHRARVACICGLPNALQGWAHRRPSRPTETCFASGSQGRMLPKAWLDIVHPELAPKETS